MASRTSTFVFKEPDQLRYQDFDFNQYTEFFEQPETTEDMLINYIVNEASAFRESMIQDLNELRRERDNLGSKVGEAQQKNGVLAQSARSIKRKFDEANASLTSLQARFEAEKESKTTASEQLSDIKKMIKGMTEAKAKYLKGCDKESLKKIKSILSAGSSQACATGREILDGMCKFIKKDTNASYATVGDSIFSTPESLSKAVKDCMPTDMDRAWLQSVAGSVNQNTENQKGALLQQVSNPSTAGDMVHFFPYFKIYFKFAQLGMTITKRESLQRQTDKATKAMLDAEVDMEKQRAIADNLEFYMRIESEVNRANEQEVETLRVKSDEIERKIQQYERDFEDQDACMRNYFSDL